MKLGMPKHAHMHIRVCGFRWVSAFFMIYASLPDLLQTMTTFMSPPPTATFLAFHPQDNNIIAIGMDDSSIQIYNVRVDEVWSFSHESFTTYSTCSSYSLSFFLLTFACICILQVKRILRGHQKRITGLAFSNVLVSSGVDAQVYIYLFACMHILCHDKL